MTIRFSNQIVAELIQPFWAAWQAGEFMTDASAVAGTYRQPRLQQRPLIGPPHVSGRPRNVHL